MNWPLEGSRETHDGIIISECLDWCICEGGTIAGYRLTAKQREATNMADSVRQTDDRTHVKDSIILRCDGDGKAKAGIHSGTIEGACWPKTWSESVFAEGRNLVRHDDEWWMNNRNTWGRLYYTKDLSQNSEFAPQVISPSMTSPAGLAEAPAGSSSSQQLPVDADKFQAFSSGDAVKFLFRRAPLAGPLQDYFGDIRPLNPNEPKPKPRPEHPSPPDPPRPNGGRISGEPCRCDQIIGSYSKMSKLCKMLCGADSEAHHIWGDKHFRTGSQLSKNFRIQMPTGSPPAPSRGQGLSICLDGRAATEGTEHNIAHGNDALIEVLGKKSPTPGTLDFSTVTDYTTDAAKKARPDCKEQIDRASKAAAEGFPSNAPLRATNDPVAPDSPAMQLLNNRGSFH